VIEGTVESLSAEGVFTGWLRDTSVVTPVAVEIRDRDTVAACAAAQDFRPDLLRAGHGHGHYGFAARLCADTPPPGPKNFSLFLPHVGQGIGVRLVVPALQPPRAQRVEDLLVTHRAWTVAELLGHVACLDLARHMAEWGIPRFVDACFQFALTRWPSDAESFVYCRTLSREETTPDAFMEELLHLPERADLGEAIASPWDPYFPFTLAAAVAS
jgi:hypothetical protein